MKLYDLVAGYVPGIVGFFEIYDELVIKNKLLKKRLDPAAAVRGNVRINVPQASSKTAADFRDLVLSLIYLKEFLQLLHMLDEQLKLLK